MIQSIDSTETYGYRTRKNLIHKKQVQDRICSCFTLLVTLFQKSALKLQHRVLWTIFLWVLRSVGGPSSFGVGNFKNHVEKVITN